jgi:hypothetical protein
MTSNLQHVYVVNPQLGVSVSLPSLVDVNVTNPCISICDIVPINVNVTNPISVSLPSLVEFLFVILYQLM